MTGPEHYREAERLLDAAEISPEAHVVEIQQAAQVHATLALAAATATEFCLDLAPSNDVRRLWLEVAP